MKRKVFIILFIMFSFQFFFSCIQEDEECGGFEEVFDYNNTYTGVSLEVYGSSVSESEIIDKSTFGILISMNVDSQVIAMRDKKEKN